MNLNDGRIRPTEEIPEGDERSWTELTDDERAALEPTPEALRPMKLAEMRQTQTTIPSPNAVSPKEWERRKRKRKAAARSRRRNR